MTKLTKVFLLSVSVLCLSVACTKSEDVFTDTDGIIVKCIVPPPGPEEDFASGVSDNGPVTKASVQPGEFAWDRGDKIGIVPSKGAQIYFEVDEGAGTSSASFDGGAWALKSNATYWSYYPFYADYSVEKSRVPVSFDGQCQDGNGSTAHCGKHWCLYSSPASAEGGALTFNYHHLTSFFKTYVTLPAGTYTRISYSAENELFIKEGYFDLSSESPTIVAEEYSKEISLDLKNVTFTEPTELVSFLIVAPVDLTDIPITVTVYDSHGIAYSYSAVKTKPMEPTTTYAFRASSVSTSIATEEAANAAFAAGETVVNFSKTPEDGAKLILPDTVDDVTITFPAEESDVNITVSYAETATQYPANLNFAGPDGAKLTFNTPNTTVNLLDGDVEEKNYSSIHSATAKNTLVVNSKITVGELSVDKGGVAVYGTVDQMNLSEDDDAVISVYGSVDKLNAAEDDYQRVVYHFAQDCVSDYCLDNYDKDGNGLITHDEAIDIHYLRIALDFNDRHSNDVFGISVSSDLAKLRSLDLLYISGLNCNALLLGKLAVKSLILDNAYIDYLGIADCDNLKTLYFGGPVEKLDLWDDIETLYEPSFIDLEINSECGGTINNTVVFDYANPPYVDIPDINFLSYCMESVDSDGDCCIFSDEAAAFTAIDCSERSIKSLEGLLAFTKLQSLDCSDNSLSGILDISYFKKTLMSFDCTGNNIEKIKVWGGFNSNNYPNFKKDSSTQYDSFAINFVDEAFKSMIVRSLLNGNDNFIYVDANGDGEIDTEEAAAVTKLRLDEFSHNIKTTEDLRYFPNLQSLTINPVIYDGDFTSSPIIDVSGACNLTSLDIKPYYGYNKMPATVILNNPSLTSVRILGNSTYPGTGLSSLDLDGCINLHSLDLCYNQLSALDVSSCTKLQFLDTTGNPNLTEIWLGQNQKITGYFYYDSNISAIRRVGVDIKFKDPAVKAICMRWDTDGNGSLSYSEAANVTSVGCFYGNTEVISFNEFQYFTGASLRRLNSDGDGVFEGCSKLEEITIPSTIDLIGESAFCGCSSLKSITLLYPGTVGVDDNWVFDGVPSTAILYVPSARLSSYQNSTFWSSKFGKILPLAE